MVLFCFKFCWKRKLGLCPHVQETDHIRNIFTSIESAVLLEKLVQGMNAGMNARTITSIINKGQARGVSVL